MRNRIIKSAKKELLMIRCMLIPSFMQLKIEKISKSFFIVFVLVTIVIFSSAFIPRPKEDKFLSRYEFAQALSKVVKLSDVKETHNEYLTNYPDLTAIKYEEIAQVINLGIMSAYPDGKFYPDKLMRKFEIIHILQLALQQRTSFSGNLKAVFPINFNNSRMDISSYYKCKLLRNKDKLSDIASKVFIKPLLASKERGAITGMITDAVSREKLSNAHLVINGKAIQIDDEGYFKVNQINAKLDSSLSFFVAAEGYQSLNFKQSNSYCQVVHIRLKPETSSVTLRAFSSKQNGKLASFTVSINNKKYYSNEFGDIQVGYLKHGNYNAIFSARGFQIMHKKLVINSDNSVVKAKLNAI